MSLLPISLIASAGPLYAIIMLASILVAGLGIRFSQLRLQLTAEQRVGMFACGFCGAMIASKLPFVFSQKGEMLIGTVWLMDGKTIMFGIVGGYLGVELAKWLFEIRVRTGDSFAGPLPFAVALGRIGCFVASCCYGTPTSLPWGVHFQQVDGDDPVFRHPTQLYEAIFHALCGLCCLAGLRWLKRRSLPHREHQIPDGRGDVKSDWRHLFDRIFRGNLIKAYLVAYLIFRFATEFIRPEKPLVFALTGYQLAALVLAGAFVALWLRDIFRARTAEALSDRLVKN